MKLKKNLLQSLLLEAIPDAPDGSRCAMTPFAQTLVGVKEFLDGARVGRDTDKAPKSVVCKADVDAILSVMPVTVTDAITLTAADIAAKKVTLSASVFEGARDAVRFKIAGSDWFFVHEKFTVSGDVLSWNGFAYTERTLSVNDVMVVHYVGEGAAG